MTQKDKELLFKDLCARLPYGFIVHRYSDDADVEINDINTFSHFLEYSEGEDFKPYLRPMSSMTEEEREEWADLFMKPICELEQYVDEKEAQDMAPVLFGKSHSISTDWLLSKGFDVRGLIPKGLALEAPEGMYNIKEK